MQTQTTEKEKVFVLAKAPTAEDLEKEVITEGAHIVRGKIFSMKLPMQVKGFFVALLDFTFRLSYGGNMKGKIYISIKALSQLLKSNKDSIAAWRDRLMREKLLWVRDSWPKSEWRILALCPAPDGGHNGSEYDYITGRASNLEQSGKLPLGENAEEISVFAPKTKGFRNTKRKPSVHLADNFRASRRRFPRIQPKPSVHSAGTVGETRRRFPLNARKKSAQSTEGVAQMHGQFPLNARTVSAQCTEEAGNRKEYTPGVLESGSAGLNVQRANASFADKVKKAREAFKAEQPQAERQPEQASDAERKRFVERAFLTRVEEVMRSWKAGYAIEEMKRSSPWWLRCFRSDPRKSEAILAEVKVKIVEGGILKNPGAMAVDLWPRWLATKDREARSKPAAAVPRQVVAAGKAKPVSNKRALELLAAGRKKEGI